MFKLNILLPKVSRLTLSLWSILSIAFIAGCSNTASVDQASGSEWSSSYAKLQTLSAEEIEQLSQEEADRLTKDIPEEKLQALFAEKFPESAGAEINWKGKQAPDFTLKDLSGKEYKLSDFRGKYVFLDFWGTWCGPCLEALPEIREAYTKVDKSKIEFIGVCAGCDDLEEFSKENDLPWIQLLDNEDEDASAKYSVLGYPAPLLIDPNGKILEEGISDAGYANFKDLMALIKSHVK